MNHFMELVILVLILLLFLLAYSIYVWPFLKICFLHIEGAMIEINQTLQVKKKIHFYEACTIKIINSFFP